MKASDQYTRRVFLQHGLTVMSAATTLPLFIQRSAFAINDPAKQTADAAIRAGKDQRILVVVQLSGGNDGLNTLIPIEQDLYHKLRPNIAIAKKDAIRLAKDIDLAWHPKFGPIQKLYEQGMVSVVQGVGYPNPNRSHFASMDIWHTAQRESRRKTGWIGRYVDNSCAGSPEADACVALGEQAPLLSVGEQTQAVAFSNPGMFRFRGEQIHRDLPQMQEQLIEQSQQVGDESIFSDFLVRTALDAELSSKQVIRASRNEPQVEYPRNGLSRKLQSVAAMIRSNLPTRVYYVSMGGFDTHNNQAGGHASRLEEFASAIGAFQNDLKASGQSQRVLTMSFSEFGRRVAQNGSYGTDHGAAAPMMLFGEPVEAGVIGPHPSLDDLDRNGDLKFHTDFRSIYADILDNWLGVDHHLVLGKKYEPTSVIAANLRL